MTNTDIFEKAMDFTKLRKDTKKRVFQELLAKEKLESLFIADPDCLADILTDRGYELFENMVVNDVETGVELFIYITKDNEFSMGYLVTHNEAFESVVKEMTELPENHKSNTELEAEENDEEIAEELAEMNHIADTLIQELKDVLRKEKKAMEKEFLEMLDIKTVPMTDKEMGSLIKRNGYAFFENRETLSKNEFRTILACIHVETEELQFGRLVDLNVKGVHSASITVQKLNKGEAKVIRVEQD